MSDIENGIEILEDGTKVYYKDGYVHRDDDLPAIEYSENSNGLPSAQGWYQFGKLHRIGKPAFVQPDVGIITYYENGLMHRIDGPAQEINGHPLNWAYKGKRFDCNSLQEFHRLVDIYERDLLAFL